LLLNRGRKVSRVRLIKDVFDGMPQKNAETYLNTTIYQLRKSLEPHGLKSCIRSDNDSYGLEISGAYIDFFDFEARLKRLEVIDNSNLDQALEAERYLSGTYSVRRPLCGL
jgi:two-component system LytT family response regulator